MSQPFPCTSCGACCRRAGFMVNTARRLKKLGVRSPLLDEYLEFPYPVDLTGRCSKLGEDNLCTVYATRPLVCNIGQLYSTYMTAHDRTYVYKQTATKCNKQIVQDGMEDKYLIPL